MPSIHKIKPLFFLKLGGSLITDKSKAHTARMDVLNRLAGEIAESLKTQPGYHLILGHGSGSFGHIPAEHFGTRAGVHTEKQWRGFSEVWFEATALTRIVVEIFYAAGLPIIAFSPSSGAYARDGAIINWDLNPMQAALQANLLPIIHGDVAFDQVRGGTILSTEDLFEYMARVLHPDRVLLAGLEEGVWADYPQCSVLIPEITPATLPDILPSLAGSSETDVTGGMLSKVQQGIDMVIEHPTLSVQIFSGTKPGNLRDVLAGAPVGTILHNRTKGIPGIRHED
jgi:isopentenyl phosphate kinase